MPASDLAAIVAELRAAESVLITTHVNPDGDAVGSALALAHFMLALGKTEITVGLEHRVPRLYQWLPGAENVVESEAIPASFDIALVIDVARRDRIGTVANHIPKSAKVIVLDHHLESAPYGDMYLVDPTYAAAGEIVTECFSVAGVPMSMDAAVCAYVAITTDTGGFRFSNTNARTHLIAARLVETGIDVATISSRCFDVMSEPKFRLLRYVMDAVQFGNGGKLAYAEVTAKAMEEAGALGEDFDGIINFIRNIEGVEVAVLFREVNLGTTKVSLRSRPGFNSAEALHNLGGGGHAAAAGATLPMQLASARERVLESVLAQLRKTE
ncbi:MAG: bifunctional oligoribonuclease/PAP phosphatase NrnA [Candidatus Hydrogenedentes bacterium]|nr:bifunctional oligoribonuclease/PAP phosphatase NrnA [Candidatus Hydrogenedentota bacterium]